MPYITYYVTVSSKKNEIKISSQTRARDEYWIPCSIAITNLQNKVTELIKDDTCLVSFYGNNSCEKEAEELLKYFQADKRIYFYERTRNIIGLLSENIYSYENAVNNDVQFIIKDFRTRYYTMLEDFSIYKINDCQDCAISIKKSLSQEIKDALLTHSRIDWMGQITNISFYKKDDIPFGSSFSADMSYSSDDFYHDVWYRIREYGNKQDSFGLSSEQELALEVLDFEYENIDNIGNELNQTIATKDYQSLYTKIFETLSLLQEEILKDIDKATIL